MLYLKKLNFESLFELLRFFITQKLFTFFILHKILNITCTTFSFKNLIHYFNPVFPFLGFQPKEMIPNGESRYRHEDDYWHEDEKSDNLMVIVVCVSLHDLEYFLKIV